ncbi:MAG TPA: beta-ketoacyl synthase N-terminal-like domain-containing protein [Solirubrobacteraceae bacterium]|nr:beta-ketoacyl synthase N-terminal-like domain-containing protein [Solirubrobacteraceae bacterium]
MSTDMGRGLTLPAIAQAPREHAPAGSSRPIAEVSGWAIHIPGRDDASVGPERARELLGRKGLLYKEPATRLALCAVYRALACPPAAPRDAAEPDPHTAVVVSSNLGNVETVTRVARAVYQGSVRDVSPLDAPNASSNVIASTIAIWFRLGGPNLMVCSGATGGLDAVRLAGVLLAVGRARRVVVVGVEPDDPVARALEAGRRDAPCARRLRAGAAALVLTAPGADAGADADADAGSGAGAGAGALSLGRVRASAHAGDLTDARGPLFAPRCAEAAAIDLEAELGGLYGALGVVQVAAAAELLAAPGGERSEATVMCGDAHDGWRSLTLTRAAGP